MKTAIVLGATGLVGREIVSLLEADPDVGAVVLLVRRRPDRAVAAKTRVHLTDFRDPTSYLDALAGADVLFSALGTTRKVAGSEAAQYEIDHTFPFDVARAAKAAGVTTVGIVSSLGADAGSRMFYARMKGELDRDVAALGFTRTRIVRPSVLEGDRAEPRPGERVATWLLGALPRIGIVKKMRPIHVRTVAAALVALCKDAAPGVRIVESPELFALGGAT